MSTEEIPEPVKLREFLNNAIQEGFNQQSAGIGAHVVTDWVLVAEVHNGDHPVLRLADSGLPLWRTVGLLEFAKMDAAVDMSILAGTDGGDE